jgi:hypothetical protein
MHSRNHGILGATLTGELNLELAYDAPAFGMADFSECGAAVIAGVEIDTRLEDVAFLLCKN